MAKRLNGNVMKWVAVFGAVVILLGWVWQAAHMEGALQQNCQIDAEAHPKIQENREDIRAIQKDVEYIREGIDRIDRKLPQ